MASSDPANTGSASDGAQGAIVDRDLAAQFRKRNNEQQKRIKDMNNGNLELQSMVLATTGRYKSGQLGSDGDVLNLAGKVQTGRKRKVDSMDSQVMLEAPEKPIARANGQYSLWGKSACRGIGLLHRGRLLIENIAGSSPGASERVA